MRSIGLGVLCGWALFGAHLFADDWPQWLGPRRDAVWREAGIVEKFPTNRLPVRWRTKVGGGYAGPSVALGRVYVADRQRIPAANRSGDLSDRGAPRSVERVLCLRETDGEVLWEHQYECPYTISYPAGPRVTPTVSEGKVYTLGAEGKLICLDAVSGEVLWSRDFKGELGIQAPMWGFAGHPLVEGQRLICLAGGAGTTVLAFEKHTGREIWRALSAEEPGYSSPILCEAGGRRQVILWHPEAVSSLDPETGLVYWSVPFKSRLGVTLATPRKLGDRLFFTTFYNGSLMLRLDSAKPGAVTAWRTLKMSEKETTHLNAVMCTPFLEAGHIYGVCSYGQLRCLNMETGERMWETFAATTSGGSVRWANAFIVKNGDRFFLFNEAGDLIIAKLSPIGYEEISRAHLIEPANKDCGRPVVWSHPAFANRRVYARNDQEIICVDLAQKR
ncbi:MAG TPA: PQQ-like beta-propeller repeat protein [Candidatus Paceibacterota bacterium]|nr:PQQ-like beta-propeller repeat protein [Verrucomicrobiota bacterium]HSA12001.1 PQQ-like beta-propeller repeat protein [Candidatus Paceibacterota bacterium]